jgi:hypothetical protein
MGALFNMKEKKYYSDFTKKINSIKKELEIFKKDIKKFEDDYNYIKEKEKNEDDNNREFENKN